jgi:hypothetical protein
MNRALNVQVCHRATLARVKRRRVGLTLLAATWSLLGAMSASASVTLDGFVPGVGTAGDVVVDGASNLAYVASAEFGLAVVDISNPSQPVAVGGATPPFYGQRIAVSGALAAVTGASLGMSIVDVSVPTAPKTVGFMSGTFSGVARAGQYAYALISVAGNPPHTDLIVVDLATPALSIVGRVTVAGGVGIKVAGGLAYIAAGGLGLQIVDVSTPTAPTIITTVDTPGVAKGVAVINDYAYVADNSSIQVIYVHTPASATIVGSVSMSAASAVAVSGARLYVLDGALLKIAGITTPGSPTLLGSGDASGAQRLDAIGSTVFLASSAVDPTANKGGLYVVNAADPVNPTVLTNVYGGFGSAGVAVSGSLAVASGDSVGMKVVDISVPSAPKIKGSLGGTIGGVALAGQYAYALLGVSGNPAHTDLLVVDLGNPAAPAIRAQLTLAGGADIKVSGGFVYVAAGSAGLQIVNVATPTSPQIVQTVDTPGSARGVALANGYAYVADNSSVQIVDVHTPATAFIAGAFSTSMTAVVAVAVVGNQVYVIDGTQLKILNVSTPSNPTQLGVGSAYGAQAIDASSGMAYLAHSAISHGDPAGGLYIVDVTNAAQPTLLTQLIVPGLTRAVAATTDFVYAGDSAAVVDVGRITVPAATPTRTHSSTPAPTSTSTRSPTASATSMLPSATPTPVTAATATRTGTPAATPTTGPPPPFGSFRCYSAHATKNTTPFSPVFGTSLVDRFATLSGDVRHPVRICNPASVNGQAPPVAPAQPDHLTGYKLRVPRKTMTFVKLLGQHVVNQFESVSVDVVRPTRLFVPGVQSLSDPPPTPVAATIDSFNCYKIRRSAGVQNATAPATVIVADQFGSTTVNLKAPKMLCVPVNMANADPGAEAHPDLLMCYRVTPVRGTPAFEKVAPVFVANELQQGTLDVPRPVELCVPTHLDS